MSTSFLAITLLRETNPNSNRMSGTDNNDMSETSEKSMFKFLRRGIFHEFEKVVRRVVAAVDECNADDSIRLS